MADSPLFLSTHGQQPAVNTDQSKIGDLRRRYNFGASVSELAIDQTPFFRFVSQVASSPTDDPEFKSTEERASWHKRYAHVIAVDNNADADTTLKTDANYAHDHATDSAFALANHAAGGLFAVKMESDFNSQGNIQSVLGQSGVSMGGSNTKPIWLLKGQLLKVPVQVAAAIGGATISRNDYMICSVENFDTLTTDTEAVGVLLKCVRPVAVSGTERCVPMGASFASSKWTIAASSAEKNKVYAVGTAHAEGSSFPSSFKDTPYMVRTGYTQIFKTTCQMTNTARATQLKLVPDEWARIWKNKLIEHKYDIEQSLLFGRGLKDGTTSYTQGIVDFALQEGNIFGWTSAKSQDDFLEDMSNFLDPRYNNANATLFMCSTEVYNWLHKISGYLSQNVSQVKDGSNVYGRYDMAISGKSKKFGLDITTISTPYGDMNVTRNIHLDGGQGGAHIVGVNMKHVKYRPLAGNGLNRDTSIYVGVQSLENTGVDRRIDLIQTEAGLQVNMPEAHAVWK